MISLVFSTFLKISQSCTYCIVLIIWFWICILNNMQIGSHLSWLLCVIDSVFILIMKNWANEIENTLYYCTATVGCIYLSRSKSNPYCSNYCEKKFLLVPLTYSILENCSLILSYTFRNRWFFLRTMYNCFVTWF